ncbi:MAG: RNA methyltransferase [Candidatus Omnitrophica bacterium]|nr:RNA methyltransferase [Candidatus Omnitrophota bacterium]
MRKLTHEELLARQEKCDKIQLPFSVILNDIRSAHNVGSIFRTADGLGIEKIYLCGITAYPPNPQITKTALDAQHHVPWEYCRDAAAAAVELKNRGYHLTLLEQTDQSVFPQDFKLKKPLCLIVGNEIDGVSQSLVDVCDSAIEIEMTGVKNSLNVSVAFGIAACRLREKF